MGFPSSLFTDYSSSTLSLVAAALVCMLLGALYSTKNEKRCDDDGKTKYPPSPSDKHWLFGHALELDPKNVGLHEKISHDVIFVKWMSKLKSKVVMFEIPILGRMIVVGDASVAEHVLRAKVKDANGFSQTLFPKSPSYANLLPLIGKKSLVRIDGQEWAHQRRLYNPGFSHDYLKGMVSTIATKCDRFLAACEKRDISQGVPTNLLSRSMDLTSDVIAEVAFGEDWGDHTLDNNLTMGVDMSTQSRKDGAKILKAVRELTQILEGVNRNPLNKIFNVSFIYKTWSLSRELDYYMQRLVQRRIDSIHSSEDKGSMNQKDILALTLSNFLLNNKDKLTSFSSSDMGAITSQLKTFYFAGHDTTATTTSWAYWLLIQSPERLERTRQEVCQNFGNEWVEKTKSGESIKGGLTYQQVQECEYLDCIVRETLRLYPPAATTRYAIDPNATFENFKLGHSVVHLNFYAIQRDPDFWGKDANEFVPERFLGDEGRKLSQSYSFLPFSKGSRDCIGKYFALLETKIALAALITRFDGVALDAENEVYRSKITSSPLNGCRVNLSLRQ